MLTKWIVRAIAVLGASGALGAADVSLGFGQEEQDQWIPGDIERGGTAIVVADEADGTVTVAIPGGTTEVADGTVVQVHHASEDPYGDDLGARCLQESGRSFDGEASILLYCIVLPGKTGVRGVIEASFLRSTAVVPEPVVGLPGWSTWTVYTGEGDCMHSDIWLQGPTSERVRLPDTDHVEIAVFEKTIVYGLAEAQVCIAPRSQPYVLTCFFGTSGSLAPDGTLWFRDATWEGELHRPTTKMVRRDTSVYRVVAGEPKLVWRTWDRVKDDGDYACRRYFSSPAPITFSADEKRAKVDGRWRKVPPGPRARLPRATVTK